MGLLEELNKSQNLVLGLNEGVYKNSVLEINKELGKTFQNIGYISLTTPTSTIIERFNKNGIDPKKYCFVDCISKKSSIAPHTKQCIYIPAPTALTKLSITISEIVEKRKVEVIFFDSISSLLIHNDKLIVIKFLHSLMNQLNTSKAKGIYLILKSDLEKPLMRDLELFADKIIKYEYLY